MEIIDDNSLSIIKICNVKDAGSIVSMNMIIHLKNDDTDTDITATTDVCFRYEDLQFIRDSYRKLLNGGREGFAFASNNKKLCIKVHTNLYHEINLQDDYMMCRCELYFTPSLVSLHSLCKGIDVLLSGKPHCSAIKKIEENSVSIIFPEIKEYIDSGLIVCIIAVTLSHFQIRRKTDTNITNIILFKTEAEKLRIGKISSLNYYGDFYDINFLRTENGISIKGEMSDFASPEENKIVFQEDVNIGILDEMIASLIDLERCVHTGHFQLK